jgi:hypothetical protein
MASATALPMKPLGVTAATAVIAAAYMLDVPKLVVNIFTGPGSFSRIVAIVLVLANLKNFPLVWHVSYAVIRW